jgi:fucose permease
MSFTTVPPLSAMAVSHAASGVRIQFFVSGALFATWGVHVPSVKAHYGLGEGTLAISMLAAGVGALLALLQAGRTVGRFGPRMVSLYTGLLAALGIVLLLAFDRYAALLAVMLLYGICGSLFDVSINAEASQLERLSGRPLMSGFHAMFSLGGMAGAAVGAALHAAGVAPQQHLLGVGLASVVAIGVGCGAMLPMNQPPVYGATLSLPRGPLALIGSLAALGLVAEGAMYDWSVLYMKQELQSDAAAAALAYASFSAAMAAARFGGDWVRARVTPVRLLQASGALGAAGMALALLVPHQVAALLGFALVGFGFANVVPVLFSAAAGVPGVAPAHGIAAVSALGYVGMMAGPPLIGGIAEASSLTVGLSTVVLFAVVLAMTARRALRWAKS